MAVTIVPNSAKLKVTKHPSVNTPDISGNNMLFESESIKATGEVTLQGGPRDSAVGWHVGFLQVQWVETNWCSYRGQKNSDGSIFIQRARPPARASQACVDCVDSSPVAHGWYSEVPRHGEMVSGAVTSTFPLRLVANHYDKPSEVCALTEFNYATNQINYLHEAQLEFHFCTILSVQDPNDKFHHQKSFYWNTRWQATFQPTTYTNPPDDYVVRENKKETGAGTGGIILGAPFDSRFMSVLDSPQMFSCNQVVSIARAMILPGTQNRHESRVWSSWDVTKP